jgi:dTMP kinase
MITDSFFIIKMASYPGKLIVIDGTDGSGKTTQFHLLISRLKEAGFLVETADFPQYNTKSSGPVEEYLSGKYGAANQVTPYQASLFYAIDRFDASFKIRQWLQEGKIVVANRYVSSNMGHQGGKIINPLERKIFFNWLYELEYKLLEIPKPDLSLILHVEATVAQELARQRRREDWSGKNRDIHEESLDHLKRAEETYQEIARTFPDFKFIRCTRNGAMLDREEIANLIWLVVKPLLNGQNQPTTKGFAPIADIISHNHQIIDNKDHLFNEAEVTTTEIGPGDEPLPSKNEEKENTRPLIVEKISPEAKLPTRAHETDAGLDLYATDCYSIPPYSQALVATGIKIALPEGYVGLIWDKSGLANQGLTTMGGVIDTGYRGEIKVVFKNLSEDIYNIIPGQKIAQLLIQKIALPEIQEGSVNPDTARQTGGFGSSGRF